MDTVASPSGGGVVYDLYQLYLRYESLGRHQEGRPILGQAVELGRQADDPAVLPWIRLSIARDRARLGEVAKALATSEAVRSAAALAGDAVLSLSAVETKAVVLLSLGRFHEVIRLSEDPPVALQLGDPPRPSAQNQVLLAVLGEAHLALGDTSAAISCAEGPPELDTSSGAVLPEMLRIRLDLAGGRLRNARRRVDRLSEGFPHLSPETKAAVCALGVEVDLWSGQLDRARIDASRMLAELSTAEDKGQAALCLTLAVRTSAELHISGHSARNTEVIEQARVLVDRVQRSANELGAVETALNAGSNLAEAEVADRHAEAARAGAISGGSSWWSASAERWEAVGHRHRSAYARLRQAERLFEEGRLSAALDSLLAAWRLSPCHAPMRRSIVGLAHTMRFNLPEDATTSISLSPRELEVMRYLAQGMTTDAIGRALRISGRTAQKHLENSYRKLNCHDKVIAVQRLLDNGLLI